MTTLHSDILENLTEYDLADIVDALCQFHDPREVSALIERGGCSAQLEGTGQAEGSGKPEPGTFVAPHITPSNRVGGMG